MAITKAPPKRRRTFHASLHPDLFGRLEAHAEHTGEPISRILDRAVKMLLGKEEGSPAVGVARAA